MDSAGGRPIGEDSGNCSTYQADFVYGACDYVLDAPDRQDLGTKSISYYPFDKYVIPLGIETRIGVFMDLWLFFPYLFVSLLSTAVLFVMWNGRFQP